MSIFNICFSYLRRMLCLLPFRKKIVKICHIFWRFSFKPIWYISILRQLIRRYLFALIATQQLTFGHGIIFSAELQLNTKQITSSRRNNDVSHQDCKVYRYTTTSCSCDWSEQKSRVSKDRSMRSKFTKSSSSFLFNFHFERLWEEILYSYVDLLSMKTQFDRNLFWGNLPITLTIPVLTSDLFHVTSVFVIQKKKLHIFIRMKLHNI